MHVVQSSYCTINCFCTATRHHCMTHASSTASLIFTRLANATHSKLFFPLLLSLISATPSPTTPASSRHVTRRAGLVPTTIPAPRAVISTVTAPAVVDRNRFSTGRKATGRLERREVTGRDEEGAEATGNGEVSRKPEASGTCSCSSSSCCCCCCCCL